MLLMCSEVTKGSVELLKALVDVYNKRDALVANHQQEVEHLKGLLKEWREKHRYPCFNSAASDQDNRCDLCKRTDAALGGNL